MTAQVIPFPKTDAEFVQNFRIRMAQYHRGDITDDAVVYLMDQDLGILDNGGNWDN